MPMWTGPGSSCTRPATACAAERRRVMLTLRHAEPIAERLRPDAELNTAADYDMDPETPMACESLVADAIGHLLSGFLIVKNLDATSRSVCGSVTTLELTSENICTVLKELNHCSVGFWQLPKAQIPVVARLREFRGPYKRRRGVPARKCERDAPADHAVEMRPRDQFRESSWRRDLYVGPVVQSGQIRGPPFKRAALPSPSPNGKNHSRRQSSTF